MHQTHPYRSVSLFSAEGFVNNRVASAYGNVSLGNIYARLIDKGWGIEAGISGAAADGEVALGNLSLSGEAGILTANANAEFVYEDGLKLGAEAKAAVATAEADFTIDLWLIEIEIGANADFLSAGAEAGIGAYFNDEGKFEIGAEAGVGLGFFGFGLDLALIIG